MNKFMKIVAFSATIIFTTSAFAADKEAKSLSSTHVLAKVGNEKVRVSDVQREFTALPENARKQGIQNLLGPLRDSALQKIIIEKQALKDNLKNSKAFKDAMRRAERETLVQLFVEEIRSGVAISKKDLDKEYANVKKEFAKIRQARAFHIAVKSRKEAEKIISALKKGKNFKSLAKSKSVAETAKNGGELGYVSQGQMPKDFDEALFDLKNGRYTKTPIKIGEEWHVIKKASERTQPVPPRGQVEAALRQRIEAKIIDKKVSALMKKEKITYYDENGKVLKK